MNEGPRPDRFLSCDWGTSSFRLHLAETRSGRSLASVASSDGVRAVDHAWRAAGSRAPREEYFLDIVRAQVARLASEAGQSVRGLALVISGMVTSSIGLRDIPHKPMPFALDGSDLRVERLDPPAENMGPVLLVAGVRVAEDFMRGEEIQVVGAVALGADRRAWFILPGTHSKHVWNEGDRAVGVRTHMTGEFFELLARRSILANSVEEGAGSDSAGADAAFDEGVTVGAAENLLHASFGVRVAELSGRRSRPDGFHYLSGLVIGAELRELRSQATAAVVLVGSPALTKRYTRALQVLGHTGAIAAFAAESAVIAGHEFVARRAGLLA